MQQINPNWEISFQSVTPAMAAEMLKHNTNNRRLRIGLAKRYALTMESGHWQLSPDAICFDVYGTLIQGQHRLTGIVLSGCTIPMMIIRNIKREVFQVLDRGAMRSHADALGIDRRLAEVARLAASLQPTLSGVQDHEVMEMADMLSASHEKLIDYCPSSVKVFSSAPVRLAACLRMMVDGSENYVLTQYKALVMGRAGELSAICQSFMGAVATGRLANASTGGSKQRDLLARAWRMFDISRANQSKIQISDVATVICEIRSKLQIDTP